MAAKRSVKIILSLFLILLALLAVYYFMPKSQTGCGSILPLTCRTCTCQRGFIYSPTSFGGAGNMNCFLGGEPICGESFRYKK